MNNPAHSNTREVHRSGGSLSPAATRELRDVLRDSISGADLPTLALIYYLTNVACRDRPPEHAAESIDVEVDLTVADVAKFFGRTPQTVRGWIREGMLVAYKLNGREYRITRAAVEEYQAKARNAKATSPSSTGTVDLSSWKEERQDRRSTSSD